VSKYHPKDTSCITRQIEKTTKHAEKPAAEENEEETVWSEKLLSKSS